MRLRITTWNINSVRLRIGLVARLVGEIAPDVLCLQETKVADPLFPHGDLADLGFVHRATYGMKGYNGVAILSKIPFAQSGRRQWCGRDDARHVHATLKNGVELHNFYVPAGGDVADPGVNLKFAHKLAFLDEVQAWLQARRRKGVRTGGAAKAILVGDLNIAPLETDVWSHTQLLDVVSHTPVETGKLLRWQKSLAWVDASRHFVPPSEKLFTWWSYRNQDWSKSDRGRRLDHVWVTPDLAPGLRAHHVSRVARDWERPSDHVPVTVELSLPD